MNASTIHLLTTFASTLGVTVKYLWGVELHQAYIAAIQFGIWSVLLLIAAITLGAISRILWKEQESERHKDYALFGIVLTFTIVCFVFSLFVMSEAVSDALNPANFAFNEMINKLS